MFYVEFEGRYLIRAPEWDKGLWTNDLDKATKYGEYSRDFFKKNYPKFNILIVEK